MTERMIRTNGAELATEAFGDPAHPPLLLLMGGMASMLWWPDEFCRKLASHNRYVIRYDQRDTGHSTKYPPGNAPYTLDDFVKDAIGVLDEYGIAGAHIVGMSLGGMIGQLAAVGFPGTPASICLSAPNVADLACTRFVAMSSAAAIVIAAPPSRRRRSRLIVSCTLLSI